jgi:hypothetical protein
MYCNETANDGWFTAEIADLIVRIRRVHEADERWTGDSEAYYLDANWSRVYGLLVQLHEHMAEEAGREVVASVMTKLDRELVVIESLVGGLCPADATASVH